MRRYRYVGPDGWPRDGADRLGGTPIHARSALDEWARAHADAADDRGRLRAKYVVDCGGRLRLGPRRKHLGSENEDVLAAGELRIENAAVIAISNQSFEYCPDESCWEVVRQALDAAAIPHPGQFTVKIVYRRCAVCGAATVVRNGQFECRCGQPVSREWNFQTELPYKLVPPVLALSDSMTVFLMERIANYVQEARDNLRWLEPYVREFDALPLGIGWTEILGLTATGRFLRWSTEGSYEGSKPIEGEGRRIVALVEGCERYPGLRALIPPRPDGAEDCPLCGGSGRIYKAFCKCWGLGWTPWLK